MDALIRAARLAPIRTRLSETRATAPASSQPVDGRNSAREEIERAVRAELAAELAELYDAERERARTDGYAAGMAEANRAAAEEIAKSREQLRAKVDGALTVLERAHEEALSRIESSVGEVAFAAVCRFVSRQAASRDFVLGLVEHACAQLRTETIATARLHPRDVALLEEMLAGGVLQVQSIGLKLVADESLPLGGCVVDAASGEFDGGLENQLRRLRAVLTRVEGSR